MHHPLDKQIRTVASSVTMPGDFKVALRRQLVQVSTPVRPTAIGMSLRLLSLSFAALLLVVTSSYAIFVGQRVVQDSTVQSPTAEQVTAPALDAIAPTPPAPSAPATQQGVSAPFLKTQHVLDPASSVLTLTAMPEATTTPTSSTSTVSGAE